MTTLKEEQEKLRTVFEDLAVEHNFHVSRQHDGSYLDGGTERVWHFYISALSSQAAMSAPPIVMQDAPRLDDSQKIRFIESEGLPVEDVLTELALADLFYALGRQSVAHADSQEVEALWNNIKLLQADLVASESERDALKLQLSQRQDVPEEPTEEMLLAAMKADMYHGDFEDWMEMSGEDFIRIFKAMLSAARVVPESETKVNIADPIDELLAIHAEYLIFNEYCYFELAYTRKTEWMAWLCTKPREDDPERQVLACGQGSTPREACNSAIADRMSRRIPDSGPLEDGKQ